MTFLIENIGQSRRFASMGRKPKSGVYERYLSIFLLGAAILSGFATYAAMSETVPFGVSSSSVFWLLNVDLVILLLLLTLTANRIISLWSSRRKGVAGSQLQTRLVLIFSILAAAPAIIMTIFSAYFFHYGVQNWFSDRVKTAVVESRAVADAYLEEHQSVIKADIRAMAQDLDRYADELINNPQGFERYIKTQAQFRNFSEAVVFTKGQNIYAQTGKEGEAIKLSPEEVLKEAEKGKVVLMTTPNEDRVRALVELEKFEGAYLYVARPADPTVLGRVQATRVAADRYDEVEGNYSDLQIKTMMIFIVVALVLLLSAIWAGLVIARQMTTPVIALINAAERVRSGDLTVRVPEFETMDELDYLSRGFNRMTAQIATQRDELMGANRQLDHRRRFTETILAGVSAGIIGVDTNGKITIANNSAAILFSEDAQADGRNLVGRAIGDLVPGLPDLLEQAHETPHNVAQFDIPYLKKNGSKRILLVRIAFELIGDKDVRAVITFDDITELQSAQRKAAWSDVARRIAHEIKNPLTPIQLSAERLKRKYMVQIKDQPEIFVQCIETIIRQVDDIGRMVNEFSSFARMPEPVMKLENIEGVARDTLFLHQQATPEIKFSCVVSQDLTERDKVLPCDGAQLRQAITNLVQNAVDSVQSRMANTSLQLQGEVQIRFTRRNDLLLLMVNDNGEGLPQQADRERLLEPYVTFKEKGTGLGLAIVAKIMEDHKGRLEIGTPLGLTPEDTEGLLSGATFTLVFPLAEGMSDVKKTNTAAAA